MSFISLKCCVRRRSYSFIDHDQEQRKNSKIIDKYLFKESKIFHSKHFILLLGTGESGKSTFAKQIRIINGQKFTHDELSELKIIIYDNIVKGILFLIDARSKLELEWSNPDTSTSAKYVEETYDRFKDESINSKKIWTEKEFLQYLPHIKQVWSDESVQIAFSRRSEFFTDKFSENIRYFMINIDKIAVNNYTPTNDQIVWSRFPTNMIKELEIPIYNDNSLSTNKPRKPEATLVFVDVGGESRERHKWVTLLFSCASQLSSLLFLVGSSQFDEFYRDKLTGETRNKVQESMLVFSQIINHVALTKCALVIFFNKFDILTEKIDKKTANIREIFPDKFPKDCDPYNLEDVKTFLINSYVSLISNKPTDRITSLNKSPVITENDKCTFNSISSPIPTSNSQSRLIYRHFTTAVDSKNILRVFNALKDTLLQSNIRQMMMN